MKLVGITRVRNEGLIIMDTIEHFLGYCDHVVLYDDCSSDGTVDLARVAGRDRITVIRNDHWREDRRREETRHRAILLDRARILGADWCLYFDADERLVGELPLLENCVENGFRFRLFDGYLVGDDPRYEGDCLGDLWRMWGPEYRDILMLFRIGAAKFKGLDQREPVVKGPVELAPVLVKHFGKCLSVEHWEETCEYYASCFPEPYRSKWEARRGKAIHSKSDFDRPLYNWDQLMEQEQAWTRM